MLVSPLGPACRIGRSRQHGPPEYSNELAKYWVYRSVNMMDWCDINADRQPRRAAVADQAFRRDEEISRAG
jgi:hypothetical protein